MPNPSQVHLKDVYDVVNRIEDKLDRRISNLENDVEVLKENQSRALGILAVLSLFFSAVAGWVWNKVVGSQ